ncbi:MAG: GTPase ObgE [Actinomycetota bacterium]|nr:GTPase ObgE [Actinomycetota bacterium]
MFLDEAKINIKSGDGGSGSASFFVLKDRKKKIACGGNGGRGGDIIFRASANMSSLYNFKKKVHYKAKNGENGASNKRAGKNGEDLIIQVPIGTIIKNANKEILADLEEEGSEFIAAKGGIGGRGNASFVSQRLKFPSFAEKGEKTEEQWVELELRLLADVALVGYPNAGKSTLISKISNARPKIADYPFTTLVPNLGVVSSNETNYIVADIPGIIKGAHAGVGLGDKFLRHIMRAIFNVFVLDIEYITLSNIDISKNFLELRQELKLYNEELYRKNYIIAVNKIDILADRVLLKELKKKLRKHTDKDIIFISAFTGENIDIFLKTLTKTVIAERSKVHESHLQKESADSVKKAVYTLKEDEYLTDNLEVKNVNGEYVVKNKRLERMVSMTNLENEEALIYLRNKLKKMGIGDKLKKTGIPEGSTVIIGELVFELIE